MSDWENIDVGFVEKSDPWKLHSKFFPSKVGGFPAWLDLLNLPSEEQLQCKNCLKPSMFLCQVYAPIEHKAECFHRTLFVFICREPNCCSPNNNKNFIVFRCQLRRDNTFYPFEPPEFKETWMPDLTVEKWSTLCAVCGCRGNKHCGQCKKVKYCCREHQVFHWKETHKKNCNAGYTSVDLCSSFALPEFELTIESEVLPEDAKQDSSDVSDDDDEEERAQRILDFLRLEEEGRLGTLSDSEEINADLLRMASCDEDKRFSAFKSRLGHNPGQVLRYDRGGRPLWLSDDNVPQNTDIPLCQYCGSDRVFEFQVLPQLLTHLSLDTTGSSIDWGVLSVFTCEKSCEAGPSYKAEFLWKQDIMS